MPPKEVMFLRWRALLEKTLPAIDLIDITAEKHFSYAWKRQFAPEFSQDAYMTMLNSEFIIGDYVSNSESAITQETRRHMVTLLEALNQEKEYKQETLYLAASLSDRYLV